MTEATDFTVNFIKPDNWDEELYWRYGYEEHRYMYMAAIKERSKNLELLSQVLGEEELGVTLRMDVVRKVIPVNDELMRIIDDTFPAWTHDKKEWEKLRDKRRKKSSGKKRNES